MGSEKAAPYYDSIYSTTEGYKTHWSESYYNHMWLELLGWIEEMGGKSTVRILDIGCGPGQFAELLQEEGYTEYIGFDFSIKAIEMARERCAQSFFVADALDGEMYNSFEKLQLNTVVCTETLEHIEDDLYVMDQIPPGTHVLISLPKNDDPSHVRVFKTVESVLDRYADRLIFRNINEHPAHWTASGMKI